MAGVFKQNLNVLGFLNFKIETLKTTLFILVGALILHTNGMIPGRKLQGKFKLIISMQEESVILVFYKFWVGKS